MLCMSIYSKDLRTRAVAAVERGTPRKEVVEIFSVSLTTLKRWLRMKREGKDLSPGVSTGRKRRILATLEEKKALWKQLEENDDATLEFHCQMWEQKTGIAVSIATMSRAIREKLGWTYKKRRPSHRARRRSAKCFHRAPEKCRSEATGLCGRILYQHSLHSTLRPVAQRRKGIWKSSEELGQERNTYLLDHHRRYGTIHEHSGLVGYGILRTLYEKHPSSQVEGRTDRRHGQPLRTQECQALLCLGKRTHRE